MYTLRSVYRFSAFLFLSLYILSCSEPEPKKPPVVVRENPDSAAVRAKTIRENTAVELASGLTLSLWASDSLAPDPIAMSIDNKGRVYLTRTNRQKNSEFDIRGHQDWMTASISLQSVEDRRAFLRRTFAPEKSDQNEWLEDLNSDSIHDWQDLAVEQDEVWRLSDTDGDGIADESMRIIKDFDEEVTDVAGALLVRDEDVFVGIGPDMWRLKDTDGDGVMDEKESISHGYAVHIGFGGHGMSGAIEGPDGRIYWGIGDIGANITAKDGSNYPYPNEGVIVRSNPDGSDFEVFASGLRNTHEFVFDAYGNIISSDNDGDHRGESERLVHIVQGSDAGWRTNWQFGKYTDPRNNSYKVWMDEELYKPRWEGQAAYIIPPIQNYHNGPTGMVFNPGTALGSAWKNHFFLVEFVGNPSRSPVWAFTLKPSGASFVLEQEKEVVRGILPTGIEFGPDGALYIADWVNGWNTKNYGRVWKLDVTEDKNDLEAERAETRQLMQLDYGKQPVNRLQELLSYSDMRVRQMAQFELVNRGKRGMTVFRQVIGQQENQLARIHGIWGIGQLTRERSANASTLVPLLKDSDPEIVAQAAKVLGDVRYAEAAEQLLPLLTHDYLRARFYAAEALGRIKHEPAIEPLLKMIEENNDRDVYIRHAAVLALARIGREAPIVALAQSSSRAQRIAGVLVLRRLGSEKVSVFLGDSDEYIATEAARAINDDLSIEKALPELAAALAEERFTSGPLLRRAINAALRVGGEKEIDLLMAFAMRNNVKPELRAEALAALGTWANPSVLDRVDGRYRGEVKRDPEPLIAKVKKHAESFLQQQDPGILVATAKMLSELGISDFNPQLVQKMQQSRSPEVRSAMLTALYQLDYDEMPDLIKAGMNDSDVAVRTVALGLLNELEIPEEELPGVVNPIFEKGTLQEQQEMLRVLGKMPLEKSEPILAKLIDQLKNDKLNPSLQLDLVEAVDSTKSENLIAMLEPLRASDGSNEEMLNGGDVLKGRRLFFSHPAAQCTRCHTVQGEGTMVGPQLAQVGTRLSREQLLQSLLEPGARLAPGFGAVTLTLKDGQVVSGILMAETDQQLTLKTSEAEPLHIAVSRIAERRNAPSSMPPMGTLLTKREIRDLVEFLAELK